MAKRLADIEESIENAFAGAPAPASAAPGPDTQAAPAAQPSGQPGAQAPPSSAGPWPPTRLPLTSAPGERPRHPHWEGQPVTETAIRLLHLWPRQAPAPLAIIQGAQTFAVVMAASQRAYAADTSTDKAAGIRAATQVLVDAMADAHRELGEAGAAAGAPKLELLGGAEDVPPADPARVRFDQAVVVISKLQVALHRGYDRGGAWREAVQAVTRPSGELSESKAAESLSTVSEPQEVGHAD